MVMYFKETDFDREDSNNKGYSLEEFDIYSNESYQYRLRKNLITGRYEFYRYYWRTKVKEVIYTYARFSSAIRALNRELKEQESNLQYTPIEKGYELKIEGNSL